MIILKKYSNIIDRVVKKTSLEDSEQKLKLTLYLYMMTASMLTIFLFIIYDIFKEEYLVSIILSVAFTIIAICIYSVYRRINIYVIYNISASIFFILFLFLIYFSQYDASRLLWCYSFPIVTIFVLGVRALIWNICFILASVFVIVFFLLDYYAANYIITFVAIYLVITTIVSWIEFYKTKYYKNLNKQHDLLQKEIDKKTKLEYKLIQLSRQDSLTNILNQRFFWESVDREIDIAKRYDNSLCLAVVDVDNFKNINDYFGHLQGDKILVEITKYLKKTIRKNDLIGRIGGDEFAILFLNITCSEAYKKLEEVRYNISSLELKDLKNHKISISAGLAGLKDKLDSYEKLYKNADAALYEAKKCGRDKIVLFNQMQ